LSVDEKWGEVSQDLQKKPNKTTPKSRVALIKPLSFVQNSSSVKNT
jgi:hypothetical protein